MSTIYTLIAYKAESEEYGWGQRYGTYPAEFMFEQGDEMKLKETLAEICLMNLEKDEQEETMYIIVMEGADIIYNNLTDSIECDKINTFLNEAKEQATIKKEERIKREKETQEKLRQAEQKRQDDLEYARYIKLKEKYD